MLKSLGCDITEVDNCNDLHAHLETAEISGRFYNLVVVDFKIDGTDGFSVCAKIRKNKDLNRTCNASYFCRKTRRQSAL